VQETDPALRAQAAAMDEALPKAEGADAAAMDRFRSRVSAARPGAAPAAAPAQQAQRTAPAGPVLDLTKLDIPILAVNGSFDGPYAKTQRLWRETQVFQNVILPGKTHLTAIAVGGPMPERYIDAMVKFINANDVR
jgi:hypothetical protein